jgi:hypothetical protein
MEGEAKLDDAGVKPSYISTTSKKKSIYIEFKYI